MARFRSVSALMMLAIVCALAVPVSHMYAANGPGPGELLLDSSGILTPGQQLPLTLYSGGPANIRLEVSGGAASNSVKATLQGGDTASWTARTGETIWGYATLPQQNGVMLLQNLSPVPLTYTVKAYAIDTAPSFAEGITTLSGVAQSAGGTSAVQINAASSGLYRFTLGATAGSYQLKVDDGAIVKSSAIGATPQADDSVYFLTAGVHTLTIVQNAAAASTTWSIGLAPVGGTDTLPTTEQAAQLGGPVFFSEERIPLQVSAAQAVNLRLAATGGVTDSVTFELYNGATKVFTSSPVFGGEVAWGNGTLAAGANAIRVIAKSGNAAPLAYAVQVIAVAQTPLTWEGVSYGAAQHTSDGRSQIQLNFPTDGLYRFVLTASAGRYQLTLNDGYLRKTVTVAGSEFSAFVPAGAQTLTVVQDPAAAQTAWKVAITATEQASDALPFSSKGGTLGGGGNAFREEWIPVQVAAGASVNLRLTAQGAAVDAVKVEVLNGDTSVFSAASVYGSEVYWANTKLAAGKNLIHITAPLTNTGQMAYELTLNAVASIPTNWGGISHGVGARSALSLNAPVSATYLVTVTIASGAGQIKIDSATAAMQIRAATGGTQTVLRVPLTAGPHMFVFQQDAAVESTTWSVATDLRRGAPVTLTSVFLPLTQQ